MRIRSDGKLFDVCLENDGTLDTVISVQPVAPKKRYRNAPNDTEYFPRVETRFDCEYASQYRDKDGAMTERGLRELGREACADYYEFEE
jgi:hypothetical protein